MLLAMPDMPDPFFQRSVVAICADDDEGALGIAVHDEIPGVSFGDVLASFDITDSAHADMPVLRGGPVEPKRGFVLHSLDWSGEGTLVIESRWALSGSIDVLRAIAGDSGPSRFLIALGYTGWGPGQLDTELQRPGWFLTTGSTSDIFDGAAQDRWARAFRTAGVNPDLIASTSGHA